MKTLTPAVKAAAIAGFEQQKREIDLQIAALRQDEAPQTATPASKRRNLTAAGRKALSENMEKRWAERRAAAAMEVSSQPKRHFTAADRKRMLAQRKRHAANKPMSAAG
jgi:hypothetical protein